MLEHGSAPSPLGWVVALYGESYPPDLADPLKLANLKKKNKVLLFATESLLFFTLILLLKKNILL